MALASNRALPVERIPAQATSAFGAAATAAVEAAIEAAAEATDAADAAVTGVSSDS